MPKTKISEFSATPANNTDIDSINLAEGMAPSLVNDAIRELMAQLKDFQTGAVGDSFNGPIGATTASTGAFTTLSASGTATLSGLTASTALALDASKNVVSVTNTGTGNNVLATSPTLVTPILGTPTSATLTNATGLPISTGVSGLGTGVATFLATPSSANLAAALTDETGTGSAVFATSPTLVTPVLGTPTSATLTNATGLPLTTGVTGTLPTANGGTNLGGATPFTSGGVVYASSTSALATGSVLSFDGTKLSVGSGASTSAGLTSGYFGASGYGAIWSTGVTPSTTNFAFLTNGTSTGINGSSNVFIQVNNTDVVNISTVGVLINTATNVNNAKLKSKVTAGGIGFEVTDEATSDFVVVPAVSSGVCKIGPTAGTMAFQQAGTEGMRLTSTGLGIGTTSPGYRLHAVSSAAIVSRLGSSGGSGAFINFIDSGASPSNAPSVGAIGNNLVFMGDGSASERARIDSSGSFGIGTTSPAAILHTSISGSGEVGRFATTTDSTPYISIYSNGGIRAKLRASTAETALLTQGSTPLLLGTNDTERARIDSSGNLLVGTQSVAGAEKFRVYTTGAEAVSFSNDDLSGSTIVTKSQTASASTHYVLGVLNSINGVVGRITHNDTSTSYVTSSDYRLKENIAPMTGALATVAQLKPCTYTWKSNGSTGQGFIAHELQSVLSDAVVGEKDAVDADGNPEYQGIDTSFLVATLTAAIQELKAEFDAYKASHP